MPHTPITTSVLLAALSAFVAAASPVFAQTTTTAPSPEAATAHAPVVATVNGHQITETDVKLAEAEIGGQLGRYPDQIRRRVLIEFLIENQLFAQAAAEQKMQDGKNYKEKINYWRRRMLRDTYFEKAIRTEVGDADVKKFYDERVAKAGGGPEVKASHILVETEDKAKEIYEQIAHGAEFAEMAAKHSKDPGTKTKGGSLGYFGKGRMVPAFDAAVFQLKVGEVSLPVKSRFGWHLIKVEDKRDRKPPTLAAVKDQIVNALMREKANDLGKKLRSTAKITYPGEKPRIGPAIAPPKQ